MSQCPADFPYAGVDCSGLWVSGTDAEIQQDRGACNRDTAFSKALQDAVYCFDGKGGISADLSRIESKDAPAAKGCMSFGTLPCLFKKEALVAVQFTASTSGCFTPDVPVWTAPLWMTPTVWNGPQEKSGEVDFMERCGTVKGDGFATNFGGNMSVLLGENLKDSHDYFIAFDRGKDLVSVYQCPENSNPIGSEGVPSSCALLGENSNYFSRTTQSGDDGNTFHFVSDIWNTQKASAGDCTPSEQSLQNRSCKYEVTNLKVLLNDAAAKGEWLRNPVCRRLLP